MLRLIWCGGCCVGIIQAHHHGYFIFESISTNSYKSAFGTHCRMLMYIYTDIYIYIYLKTTLNSLYVYMYNNDLSPTATTNRQHRTMSIDNLSYYYNVNIYCYRVHVDESINVIVFLGNFVRAQTKFLVVS